MALTGVVADTGDRDTEISSRTQSFARRDVPLHMPTDMSIGQTIGSPLWATNIGVVPGMSGSVIQQARPRAAHAPSGGRGRPMVARRADPKKMDRIVSKKKRPRRISRCEPFALTTLPQRGRDGSTLVSSKFGFSGQTIVVLCRLDKNCRRRTIREIQRANGCLDIYRAVAPLVGPERTSFYEVILRPTEPRAAGEVSREVVRILIRDDPGADRSKLSPRPGPCSKRSQQRSGGTLGHDPQLGICPRVKSRLVRDPDLIAC